MSIPAGGGRRRRRRTGCFLGAQQGTGRPSVWGGGPEPSSGAAGRPSCPTCLTFHPEPPPVHRTHADNGSRPNRQIISYITSSQIDLNRQEITLRVFFPQLLFCLHILWENHSKYSEHHRLQCVYKRDSVLRSRRADADADCIKLNMHPALNCKLSNPQRVSLTYLTSKTLA